MDDKSLSQLAIEFKTLPNSVEECHVLIRELLNVISELFTRVEKSEAEVKKQAVEITALKELLSAYYYDDEQ